MRPHVSFTGFSVILEEVCSTAQACQRSCLTLCCIRDRDMEPVPPGGPPKHTQLPTCDKLLLPSPFPLLTVSAFSSHSGLSGVSLKWWLLFPSSSLSYGNGSYDYSPFHTFLCMEAECLCNSYGLVRPSIFILTAANWRTTVFLILLLVISHYSTTMAHKKGLQPSTTFWEGTHLTQVFQVFVWEMVSWVCLPTRRFNC